jgi:ribonuclease HI
MIDFFLLHSDGASKGNPGHSGAGAVLFDPQGNIVFELGVYLGINTNNVAEYQGLILGLTKALDFSALNIEIKMDSELVVRQISGQYRVKNINLLPLFAEAQKLLKKFEKWKFNHVLRHLNSCADKLASQAAEAGGKGLLSKGQDLIDLSGGTELG